jgi:cyclophilin family peptidyl-prolyl cis-trans isomerase
MSLSLWLLEIWAGGDTIYGGPFPDKIHSRLRFNHRGVVACANAGTPHTNNSQFFITFDRCDWLDKKNTIFGKVSSQFKARFTILAALRMVMAAMVLKVCSGTELACLRQITGDTVYNLMKIQDWKQTRMIHPW